MNVDIEGIQEEARNTFDMHARLAGVSRRTKEVTVYLDDTAGAELGGVEDETIGEFVTGRKIRTGLIGRLDEIAEDAKRQVALLDEESDDYEEKVAAINASLEFNSAGIADEIKQLRERLHKSSMTFTLQALPDVIVRGLRRQARAALDITTKGIPESLEEEFDLEYTAQFLAASVSRWVDNQTGEVYKSLTADAARSLRDLLPPGQFPRLNRAMVELSHEVAISNQATDSADFS